MAEPKGMKRSAVVTGIFLFALLMITMVAPHLGAGAAQAATANMAWSAPTTNSDGTPLYDLAGYKVYIGSASGSYQQKIDVGDVRSYTASNLTDGGTYYFAVTAYDSAGLESGYSNEVRFTLASTQVTSYSITATAGAGGSISALNNSNVSTATNGTSTITTVKVNSGSSQSFSIAASSGYKIADVQVDGTSVGAVSSYTFSNVTANHSISASFTSTTSSAGYTISASAGSGGTISPSGTATVSAGGSKSYTVTPNTGYYVVSVVVDGATVASNIAGGVGYSYTFSSVSANHTISATFAVRYYHIVASAGTGGSVSPTDTWVIYQGSQSVSITPSSGYYVADVKVDGTSVGKVTSYTFSNLSADHTLSATFTTSAPAPTSYTINATAGTGGTISPSGSTSVASGGSQSYTIAPASGYQVAAVTVDGSSVGAVTSYTFNNVTANHTIQASFAATTTAGKVVFAANAGGSAYTDSKGVSYQTDGKYSGGTTGTTRSRISNTSDDKLYQSWREGTFSYNIPLTNGNYSVTLRFADNVKSSGSRIFNVNMQGSQVISNLDIYAKAGANAAYDVTIPVSVANGNLNIGFVPVKNGAKVNAILVQTR